MKDRSIIFKYRDWTDPNHRNILQKNEFYFSSPADINDPFDFKVSPDLTLLDTSEKKRLFIKELLHDAVKISKQGNINYEENAKILLMNLENDTRRVQEEWDEMHSKYTNERFGVMSFSFTWDSTLMWSHYANNHKGFCIGLKRELLEKSDLPGSAGPVLYRSDFPKIDPLNTITLNAILAKMHTKAKVWEYEEEYRLVNLWSDSNPSVDERKLFISDEYFHEIIVGKDISTDNKEQIIKLASEKDIPVYQIIVKSKSFLLDKIKI
jgi:hypothetical protein